MTTFQDQPPQSRRALRQERTRTEEIDDSAEADRAPSGRRARAADPDGLVQVPNADEATSTTDAPAADAPVNEAPVVDVHSDDAPVVTDSAVPKAFPFAGQVEATSDDAGHPGFRLRDFSPELSTSHTESQSAHDWAPHSSEAGAADESVQLDYQTQGGPAFGYVSPYAERGPMDATDHAADESAASGTDAEPSFDSLFSDLLAPEAVVEAVDSAVEPVVDAPAAETSTVEPALIEPVPAEPAAFVAPTLVDPAPIEPLVAPAEERTLSRREWRAMRAKEETEAASEEPPVEPVDQPSETDVVFQAPEVAAADIPPLVEPEAAPQTPLSDAMAEFEALTRGGQTPAEATASPFPSLFAEPTAVVPAPPTSVPVVPDLVEPEPEAVQTADAESETAAPTDAVQVDAAPTDAAQVAVEPAAAPRQPFSFLISPSTAPAAAEADPDAYTPPVGHWSRQAQMDDESQPFENTLSRDVGGGNVATTTNALVLPMIPQRDDFSSVLNATGEIMVTGTINLPGSVGSTGRDSRHYDDPEVDHLFDALDTEVANTGSSPVRAITAVSSHTATRGGIESGRKQSNRMLNVLLVTACVMAAAVAGLLVAGFVFKIF